jgi:hypothetical protein
MSQKKYKRLEQHPRTKEWEETGVAILTDESATILNKNTKFTKIKFELAKKTKK